MRHEHTKLLSLMAVLFALVAATPIGGALSGCTDDECFESDCYNGPRLCIDIVPYTSEPDVCEQVTIEFTEDMGDKVETLSGNENCEAADSFYGASLRTTSCATPGPSTKSIEVAITHGDDTVSRNVDLAKHNYCTVNMAYLVVTLHEDGPPTFGEVTYLSPCKDGSL